MEDSGLRYGFSHYRDKIHLENSDPDSESELLPQPKVWGFFQPHFWPEAFIATSNLSLCTQQCKLHFIHLCHGSSHGTEIIYQRRHTGQNFQQSSVCNVYQLFWPFLKILALSATAGADGHKVLWEIWPSFRSLWISSPNYMGAEHLSISSWVGPCGYLILGITDTNIFHMLWQNEELLFWAEQNVL